MRWKTVIFDHDGVIANSEDIYDRADNELFRRRGQQYHRDDIVSIVMGKNFVEATGVLKARYGFPDALEDLVRERRLLLQEHYHSSLDFIPGFPEFHRWLSLQRIQSCVATASDETLFEIAKQRLRLTEFFGENLFTVAQVGNRSKPDPALFLYGARAMHSAPDECMVIEDSPNGVRAAKNAGMFCAALTTTHRKEQLSEADIVADRFEQIQRSIQ
ncbi:MAG: HAD family phosphatase [bacterium]|nr:HAD family phosphatase [bacterium]MDZ4296020.1 HAD family phosphatase [Patescibacteria group bacterium]